MVDTVHTMMLLSYGSSSVLVNGRVARGRGDAEAGRERDA
jgi:hypothetical protein